MTDGMSSSGQSGDLEAEEENVSGENEKLLILNHEVREAEFALAVAQKRRRWSNVSLFLGPFIVFLLYAMLWVPWIGVTAKVAILIPALPTAVFFFGAFYLLKRYPGGPLEYEGETSISGGDTPQRDLGRRLSEGEIELIISQIKDNRKLLLARAAVSVDVRRVTYKEDAYAEVDQFRAESRKFRNIHNVLQGFVIIGSLAATGMAGLVVQIPESRWAILGVTFVVGVSSGFMGYFKYKERSFYLQQTADAVESEWEAVEIGVGRYKHIDGEPAQLEEFVAEVHRLKSEQKQRQQNLEQPPEARSVND